MPEKGQRVLRGGNIHYEISDRVRAVDCGGLGVIQLLVKQLELAETIDQRVKVLERQLPYRESDHVLNLIYNVMTGGSCLQDVEARRRDPVYLDALGARKVPAPSTEGDFLRRFDRNSIWDLMEAVNEARRKVWSNQDKEFHRQATIDVDGTIAPTDGQCKSGIGMSYTGHWSYHPLVVSVAETNEVLYLVNRAGNRPSHEGAAEVLDRAIELVRGGGFQKDKAKKIHGGSRAEVEVCSKTAENSDSCLSIPLRRPSSRRSPSDAPDSRSLQSESRPQRAK